jgi:hypothetical protein
MRNIGDYRFRSSVASFELQRMWTKLYGGQGPVYLNDSLSSYLEAISFTF